MKKANKSLSLFLAIVMVLSLLIAAPVSVNATDPPATVFSDGDLDQVYFAGDTLSFNLSGLPVGTPPQGIPAGTPLRVSFGIVNGSGIFSVFKLFGTLSDGTADGTGFYAERSLQHDGTLSAVVSGVIADASPTGMVAVKLYAHNGFAWANVMQGQSPDYIVLARNGNPAMAGLDSVLVLPGGVTSSPVLGAGAQNAENLRNIDISFSKTIAPGVTGSIAFTGLDLFAGRDDLAELDEGLIMEQVDFPTGAAEQFILGIDETVIASLAALGATVSVASGSFAGLSASDFSVAANVAGGSVSNLAFDGSTDTVSFTVNHFSDYTLSVTLGVADGEFDIEAETGTGSGWSFASGTLTIITGGNYRIYGTGTATDNRVVINEGVTATITLDNIYISSGSQNALDIGANAEISLILKEGTTNITNSNALGIALRENADLEIRGSGTLNIANSTVGIGAIDFAGGNLTLNGTNLNISVTGQYKCGIGTNIGGTGTFGKLSVLNSNVNITASGGKWNGQIGIHGVSSVEIDSSNAVVQGNEGGAITTAANGDVTITGSTVSVRDFAGNWMLGAGIAAGAGGDIIIDNSVFNSTVHVNSPAYTTEYANLLTSGGGNIIISGDSEVTAIGGMVHTSNEGVLKLDGGFITCSRGFIATDITTSEGLAGSLGGTIKLYPGQTSFSVTKTVNGNERGINPSYKNGIVTGKFLIDLNGNDPGTVNPVMTTGLSPDGGFEIVGEDYYLSKTSDSEHSYWHFASKVLFFDDFEAYAENAYPASFTLQYNGTGHAAQKVITDAAHNGSSGKVFQLQGAHYWASEQYVNLPAELPEILIVDAYIKPVSGIWPGEIALRNLSVGPWGTRVASVWFEQSGKIFAVRNGNDHDRLVIGEYSHGNWYRVTMENNFAAKTYNVYINETLAAENLPMHPTVDARQLSLIAGNLGTNLIYFDKVGLYYDWSVVSFSPYATDVGIAGAAVVGETLTGNYIFNAGRNGDAESGTTYRWLRDAGITYSVFENSNIDAVDNGPGQPTVFTLGADTYISDITTYHWNYGSGATPGTISLEGGDGSVYGPWTATGLYGTLYWHVSPNIVLPAGSYTIVDSSPSTWAHNSQSGYQGMAWVDSKNFTGNYTPIDGATEQAYTLTASDAGSKIKFEVTVRDTEGNAGAPAESSAAGPVTMPFVPANQPPVVTSDWGYTTVYFGQNYPFTVTVTDRENTSGTRLYSYIDDAAPQLQRTFTNEPGTLNMSLSPLEGILAAGSHTLNFFAVDAAGASSAVLSLPFTLTNLPSADATLSDLSASGIVLAPIFNSRTTNYTASVANSVSSTTITVVPANSLSTVAINGLTGTAREVSLSVGSNTVTVLVTAEDGTTTETYTIVIHRESSDGGSYIPPAVVVTTEVTKNSIINKTGINATITAGTATAAITPAVVDALINSAVFTGGTAKKDVIRVNVNTPGSINELKVTVPQTSLAKMADQTDSNFAVASPFVSITFDGKALETISGAESGGSVVFTAGVIDNNALSPSDRAKVQGRTVYNFTVMNGNTAVSHFGGGHATVTIPYTLQTGENPHAVVVYYLADDGSLKAVRGHYDADAKAVVFKTTHFSKFVVGYNLISFSDVAAGAWYKNAVDFIAARGVTSGTGNNRFSPEAKLTRAQFVVLLLNAYRINTQTNAEFAHIRNFSDAGNTYYTNYLLAAKGLGIVSGTGNNRFMPEQSITRQEMFVMLYNTLSLLDELPAMSVDKELSDFNDAGQTAHWAKPALDALVKSGIVGGYNHRLYPTSETTRAESAQVLYNLPLR